MRKGERYCRNTVTPAKSYIRRLTSHSPSLLSSRSMPSFLLRATTEPCVSVNVLRIRSDRREQQRASVHPPSRCATRVSILVRLVQLRSSRPRATNCRDGEDETRRTRLRGPFSLRTRRHGSVFAHRRSANVMQSRDPLTSSRYTPFFFFLASLSVVVSSLALRRIIKSGRAVQSFLKTAPPFR